MRPRMYGSTDIHRLRTTISPGPGSGTSTSTSSKSLGFGSPTGLAARWISREAVICVPALAVQAREALGHAGGLLRALDLDRALDLHLHAAGDVGHLDDLRAAAPLR